MTWAYVVTWFGPSWLAPCGGPRLICWAIYCCVCRIWRNTSVWVAIKASDDVMGGGGGRSLLPITPNPLGELCVGPTTEMRAFIRHIAKILLRKRWQVSTCMTIAHLCIHMTMAASHKISRIQAYSSNHSSTQLVDTISHTPQSWLSTLRQIFPFACPKKAICVKLPRCSGSRPTLTGNSVVLSYLMQKCWILASAVIVTFCTTLVINA
jgi:hypothetical protein